MGILVDRNSTILVQGITGREASIFTKESLDYGARVVAGVTPGKGGQRVHGVPVYDCVKHAREEQSLGTCVISVPPFQVKSAALEAIENEVPLLVIITERVPKRDVCELLAFAEDQGTRVIGPNSLGVITPSESRLGGIGGSVDNTLKTFTKGPVGIISRSGGMTGEIANLLTQSGIGQSTCVSIGGDPLVGSDFVDIFRLFQEDSQTLAVTLYCEPGGGMEEEFAEFYAAQEAPKPVVAFVAGKFVDEMPGTRFGHAGVIVEGDRGSTRMKTKRLGEAGVHVAQGLSDLPGILTRIMHGFCSEVPEMPR